MTIPTKMCLQGFIATPPQLNYTGMGHARFYCRVGIEQHRKEVDGTVTKLDPVYCDLVLFDRAAERAHRRFKPGDQFLAVGYIHEYEHERPGQRSEIREQFVAHRIGHDCATRYVVDRTTTHRPEPTTAELTVAHDPTPIVGL